MPLTSDVEQLVVIGNGPVCHSLCEKLVRKDAHRKYEITILGEEPRPAYDRVNLTKFFESRQAQKLELASARWYQDHQITLRTGDPAIAIDREEQTVHTLYGQKIHYNRLVLATGSRPFVPPIEGVKSPGVFVYRTIEDLEAIASYSQTITSVAVLGGGLLGLEAAKAMSDLGLETTVLEMAPVLMPKQLDNQAAELLQRNIQDQGIRVKLLARTKQIEKHPEGLRIHLDNQESIDCGMVVISAGIRPRDELAHGANLEVGPRGGIVVNDQLETSDKRIYAIGECALHRETIYGLIAPGWQMADVLANQLLGRSDSFRQGDTSTTLKLLGTNVSTIGEFLQEGHGFDHLKQVHDNCYRKLIINRGRIIGAVVVGEDPELPRLHEAITHRRRLWNWQRKRFLNTGRIWPERGSTNISDWPTDSIICSCVGINLGSLVEAERSGCATVSDLSEKTKAGTVCGSCQVLLAQLVNQTQKIEQVKGSALLIAASLITFLVITGSILSPSFPTAVSMQSKYHQWEWIWRETLPKQITGFTMISLIAIGLLFSLRKRWSKFRWGNYGIWRSFHGILGALSCALVIVHTGNHYGHQLNFILITVFLLLNLLGAFAGLASGFEQQVSSQFERVIRQWRPYLTRIHIWMFWPFPVLVAFHVISVYYFGS